MGWLIRFLLLALLVLLLVRAGWRLLAGVIEGATGGSRERTGSRRSAKMVRDPICGTFVVQSRALTAFSGGETAWFCSEECRRRWESAHR